MSRYSPHAGQSVRRCPDCAEPTVHQQRAMDTRGLHLEVVSCQECGRIDEVRDECLFCGKMLPSDEAHLEHMRGPDCADPADSNFVGLSGIFRRDGEEEA